MSIDYSYMEVLSKPEKSTFDQVSLDEMRQAMFKTAIHTFGWPIGAVIFAPHCEPKAISGGIEARFTESGHRDYWTLKRTGEFYFIGELFENNRNPMSIFIDTRVNRITETFLRIGRLYKLLGVPDDELIFLMIKHGNIKGKTLGAANQSRIFPVVRKCGVNEVTTKFSIKVKDLTSPNPIKENVYRAVRDLSEMFEMFNPQKETFSDPIVDAFLIGKII